MSLAFERFIGIDYSGAKGPSDRLHGIRVYAAEGCGLVYEIRDEGGGHWSRKRLAAWLEQQVREGPPTLIGLDHAFSFPKIYFLRHQINSWPRFLTDFTHHCPTHEYAIEELRRTRPLRVESSTCLRLCETWTSSAKSVFLFDVQGTVAKSTFAGLPWLRQLRASLGERLYFWPFDGWSPPPEQTVICEVYPALFKRRYARADRGPDAHDAYSTVRWMQDMSKRGALPRYFAPPLSEQEKHIASLEGWILGVT